MKDFSRCLGISVVTYAALVVFTSLWKLFQLGGSSASVKTLLGITIDNKITEHKISTTFDFIISFCLVCALTYLTDKFSEKKYD